MTALNSRFLVNKGLWAVFLYPWYLSPSWTRTSKILKLLEVRGEICSVFTHYCTRTSQKYTQAFRERTFLKSSCWKCPSNSPTFTLESKVAQICFFVGMWTLKFARIWFFSHIGFRPLPGHIFQNASKREPPGRLRYTLPWHLDFYLENGGQRWYQISVGAIKFCLCCLFYVTRLDSFCIGYVTGFTGLPTALTQEGR